MKHYAVIDTNVLVAALLTKNSDSSVVKVVNAIRENAYLVTGNLKHFPKNGRVVSPSDMIQIIEYGKIRTDVLSEAESPLYISIPLSEIDAIINEYRRSF